MSIIKDKILPNKYLIFNIFLLAVCLFLVFFNIGRESIWADEAYSATITEHSFFKVWELTAKDCHPPLYYLALKAFSIFFGRSIDVLRCFSALGFFALFCMSFGPVRRIFNQKTACIFAFLITLSSALLGFARETRMYTWASFFVLACMFYGYLFVQNKKLPDQIKFILCTVCAAYTHYYALVCVFFICLFLLMWVIYKKKKQLPVFIISGVIIVLLYLPWLLTFLNQLKKYSADFWIAPLTYNTIANAFSAAYNLKFNFSVYGPLLIIVAFSVSVFGIIRSFKNHNPVKMLLVIGLLSYITTILTIIIFSVHIRPILHAQYMTLLTGLILMVSAFGISKITKRKYFIGVCSVFLFLTFPAILSMYVLRFNGPMNEITEYVNSEIETNDAFIHFDELTLSPFAYSFPDNLHFVYDNPASKFYFNFNVYKNVIFSSDYKSFIKNNKNLWIISQPYSPNVKAYAEVGKYLGIKPKGLTSSEIEKGINPYGKLSADAIHFQIRNFSWFDVNIEKSQGGF